MPPTFANLEVAARTGLNSRLQVLAGTNGATAWVAGDAVRDPVCSTDSSQGRTSIFLALPCLCMLNALIELALYDTQPNFESINAHWPLPSAKISPKPTRKAQSDHSRHVTNKPFPRRKACYRSLAKGAEHVLSLLALGNEARLMREGEICSAFA